MHPELIAFLDDARARYPDLQIGESDKYGDVLLTWQKWSVNVSRKAWPESPTFANIPNHSGTIYDYANPHGAMLRAFARQMTMQHRHDDDEFETFQPGTLGFMAVLNYWMEKRESAKERLLKADKNVDKLIASYADHMRHAHAKVTP